MTLYQDWKDFAICPSDSGELFSQEKRLDVAGLDRYESNAGFDEGENRGRRYVVTWDFLSKAHPHDCFESMRVDSVGNVTVWTKERVWSVYGIFGREKLVFLDRNPSVDD